MPNENADRPPVSSPLSSAQMVARAELLAALVDLPQDVLVSVAYLVWEAALDPPLEGEGRDAEVVPERIARAARAVVVAQDAKP